jgi:hypothetical protein
MSFKIDDSLSMSQAEAIKETHEMLINELGWNPDSFEVQASDPYANQNILIKKL